MRHGPHQEAQKSTRTIPSACTACSKVLLVNAVVATIAVLSLNGRYPNGYQHPSVMDIPAFDDLFASLTPAVRQPGHGVTATCTWRRPIPGGV